MCAWNVCDKNHKLGRLRRFAYDSVHIETQKTPHPIQDNQDGGRGQFAVENLRDQPRSGPRITDGEHPFDVQRVHAVFALLRDTEVHFRLKLTRQRQLKPPFYLDEAFLK